MFEQILREIGNTKGNTLRTIITRENESIEAQLNRNMRRGDDWDIFHSFYFSVKMFYKTRTKVSNFG